MSRVVFLTPSDARYGFSLTGVIQLSIPPEDPERQLRQEMADKDNGVVVIDERLVRAMGEQRYAELESSWHGLLVTLPAPEPGSGEDSLQRLIRRALGYHVRLEL